MLAGCGLVAFEIEALLQAKAQQQEEELIVANARLSDLQEQLATLQQLLQADAGPLSTEVQISTCALWKSMSTL